MEKSHQVPPPNTTTSTNKIDTSDWLTYQNKKFGYALKYPKGASLDGGPEDERIDIDLEGYLGVPADLQQERDKALGGFGLGLLLSVSEVENPDQLSIRDWLWENIYFPTQHPFPKFEKDITFKGVPANYEEYPDYGSGDPQEYSSWFYHRVRYAICFFHNGYLFEINSFKLPPESSEAWRNHPFYGYFEQYVPISEAIINSFKFTDVN